MNYAKTFFTGALPEVWLYALGALFVLVTLFLPRGLMGLVSRAAANDGRSASTTWSRIKATADGERTTCSELLRTDLYLET